MTVPVDTPKTHFDWPRDECGTCHKSLSDCTCEGTR